MVRALLLLTLLLTLWSAAHAAAGSACAAYPSRPIAGGHVVTLLHGDDRDRTIVLPVAASVQYGETWDAGAASVAWDAHTPHRWSVAHPAISLLAPQPFTLQTCVWPTVPPPPPPSPTPPAPYPAPIADVGKAPDAFVTAEWLDSHTARIAFAGGRLFANDVRLASGSGVLLLPFRAPNANYHTTAQSGIWYTVRGTDGAVAASVQLGPRPWVWAPLVLR